MTIISCVLIVSFRCGWMVVLMLFLCFMTHQVCSWCVLFHCCVIQTCVRRWRPNDNHQLRSRCIIQVWVDGCSRVVSLLHDLDLGKMMETVTGCFFTARFWCMQMVVVVFICLQSLFAAHFKLYKVSFI